ncbi:hypothetical protein [Mucilaginibacter sp. UR6-1]
MGKDIALRLAKNGITL